MPQGVRGGQLCYHEACFSATAIRLNPPSGWLNLRLRPCVAHDAVAVLSTFLLLDVWHMALRPRRAWPLLDGRRDTMRPYPCPACVSISSTPGRKQHERLRRSYSATRLRSDRLQRRALAQQANATTPHEHPRIHIWGLPVIYNADGMITVRVLVCGRFISTQCNT